MEKKYLIPIIILSILFLFSFLLFFVVLVYYVFQISEKKSENEFSRMYSYREYPLSDHSHFKTGFMKLNRKITNNEYLSYKNEETGSFFIISNSKGSEYECTGSCYCEENKNNNFERRTSGVLTNGLFVLLSAFSVSVAYNMASSTFHESCVDRFSEICGFSDIRSEVDDCNEKVTLDTFRNKEINFDQVLKETEDIDEEQEKGSYQCWGHCKPNNHYNPSKSILNKYMKEFPSIEDSKCIKQELRRTITLTGKNKINHKQAEIKFASNHLQSFCRILSLDFFVTEEKFVPDKEISEKIVIEALQIIKKDENKILKGPYDFLPCQGDFEEIICERISEL